MLTRSRYRLAILFFLLPGGLWPALFVESDLGIQARFPRGWEKLAKRTPNVLFLEQRKDPWRFVLKAFSKPGTNLDLEIEGKVDRVREQSTDLTIHFEKEYRRKKKDFDQMKIMLLEYTRPDGRYNELILFAREKESYYALSGTCPVTDFNRLKFQFLKVFRTMRPAENKFEGRNDSQLYLAPVEEIGPGGEETSLDLSSPAVLQQFIVWNGPVTGQPVAGVPAEPKPQPPVQTQTTPPPPEKKPEPPPPKKADPAPAAQPVKAPASPATPSSLPTPAAPTPMDKQKEFSLSDDEYFEDG